MNEDKARDLIQTTLAKLLEQDPAQFAADVTFDEFGVDSVVAVSMTDEIGAVIGRTLSPTLLYKYKTINQLAAHIAILTTLKEHFPS